MSQSAELTRMEVAQRKGRIHLLTGLMSGVGYTSEQAIHDGYTEVEVALAVSQIEYRASQPQDSRPSSPMSISPQTPSSDIHSEPGSPPQLYRSPQSSLSSSPTDAHLVIRLEQARDQLSDMEEPKDDMHDEPHHAPILIQASSPIDQIEAQKCEQERGLYEFINHTIVSLKFKFCNFKDIRGYIHDYVEGNESDDPNHQRNMQLLQVAELVMKTYDPVKNLILADKELSAYFKFKEDHSDIRLAWNVGKHLFDYYDSLMFGTKFLPDDNPPTDYITFSDIFISVHKGLAIDLPEPVKSKQGAYLK